MYDALGQGEVAPQRIRRTLTAGLLPRAADGRIVLAVDVSPWLRSDAPTSPDRLFCHVYGRGKGQAHLIPGWPYSFVAALEPGRTSWTALLDAVRLSRPDPAACIAWAGAVLVGPQSTGRHPATPRRSLGWPDNRHHEIMDMENTMASLSQRLSAFLAS